MTSLPSSDSVASLHDWLARANQALAEGNHVAGLAHAEQAVHAAAPDTAQRAEALTLQSTHQWRLGRFEDAVESGRAALALWERLGNDEQCCALMCHLAVSCSELALHEEALRHATAAFDRARRCALRECAMQALNRVGVCFERLGDPAQGERFLLQSLGEARELRSSDDTLVALNNLVATTIGAHHLYRQRGEHDAARQALERGRSYATQAVSLARRIGDAYRQSVIEGNLGELLGLAGEHGRALALLSDVARRADERGYRAVNARTRCNIAEVLLAQGRAGEAVHELQAVLDALRSVEHEATRMRVHSALHRAHKALGEFEAALAHCEAHHELELQRLALQNQAQGRLMVNRVEVEHQLTQSDRAQLEAEIHRLKAVERTDPLTGLTDRLGAERELAALFDGARAASQPLALALIDVDELQAVQATQGRAAGDRLLQEIAQRLRDNLRTRDFAARLGQGQFLLVLADTPRERALEICQRLHERIAGQDGARAPATAAARISIGLASVQPADRDAQHTLARADAALREAKRGARERIAIADE